LVGLGRLRHQVLLQFAQLVVKGKGQNLTATLRTQYELRYCFATRRSVLFQHDICPHFIRAPG
jgi:hypothetical protein